jgi:hypothetical protein
MKGITLPIFHHTDQSATLKDCGIEYTFEGNCEIRDVTFYQINVISEYFEDDKSYTSIHSNGSEYISSLNIKEVEKIIQKHQ